jgi:disease resistance protein RPM1
LWYSSISSKPKYLAVLDLSGLPIETIPNSIGELFNLRLLCLDDTKVKELPKSITKLQNLQTSSLEQAELVKFPQGFSNLKKLRHLMVSRLRDVIYSSFKYWEAVEPFKGLWSLVELQTLFAITASEVLVAKLGNLSQLRSLTIYDVRSNFCAQLCGSLSKMCQLSRLMIRACNEDEALQLDDSTFPNSLQTLTLYGRLSEGTFASPFFLNQENGLLRLRLGYSHLSENPVPHLSELSNLTELSLIKAYTGQELYFQAGWFLNLKDLYLKDLPHVNQIHIQEGALASLKRMGMVGLLELRHVPVGFIYLKSLKTTFFHNMHPDFKSIQKEM